MVIALSDGLGKSLFILPPKIHIFVLQMRHPHSSLYSIMIFCPFDWYQGQNEPSLPQTI